MRLSIPPSLFVASSLFCSGLSLPFFHAIQPVLEPRATYSVVPVDGGSAASTDNSGQGEVTIVKTIVETPSPATQTIIQTDTLPATTDIIISTQTIEGSRTTQVVEVTQTPSATPVTVTETEYSVIDISAPTTLVLPPTTTAKSATSTSSLATATVSESVSNTSTAVATSSRSTSASSNTSSNTSSATFTSATSSLATSVVSSVVSSHTSSHTSSYTSFHTPSASSASATSPTTAQTLYSTSISSSHTSATSILPTIETTYVSTFTTTTSAASSSTTTFDNGQWHTTYAPWKNGTATVGVASTPAETSMPYPRGLAEDSTNFGTIFQFLRRSLEALKTKLS